QHGVQVLGEDPLAHPEKDDPHQVRALAEALLDCVELAAEDLGNAREHVDVAHHDHRDDQVVRCQELGPLRHLRHLEPRVVDPRLVHLFESRHQPRLAHDAPAERLGDARDGHVVVRGPDAAGREHPVVGPRELGDLPRDQVDLVGNDRDLPDVDPELPELATEVEGVLVGNLPRQDLVADEDDPGRLRHRRPASAARQPRANSSLAARTRAGSARRSYAVSAMVLAAASIPACASGWTAASTKSRVWIAIPVGAMATIGWIVGRTWLTLPTSEEPSRSGTASPSTSPAPRMFAAKRSSSVWFRLSGS